MAKEHQSIDFDLKLNDYRKILILVKNLQDLNDDFNNDISNSSEYDGSLGTHLHDIDHINDIDDSISLNNCKFCSFYNLILHNYSKIEINNQFINTIIKTNLTSTSPLIQHHQHNQKSYVYLRYKSTNYPKQLLDLCEYQPWRSVYALVCYSVCATQSDLLNSIKKFNNLKAIYKKTLVESKLFILFKNGNDSFIKNIPIAAQSLTSTASSSSSSSTPLSTPMFDKKTYDDVSICTEMTDNISLDLNNNTNSITLSSGTSTITNSTDSAMTLEQQQQQQKFEFVDDTDFLNNKNLILHDSNTTIDQSLTEKTAEIDAELNVELKSLENNIIYLDGGINSDVNEINGHHSTSDLVKIKTVMHEIVNQIYIKIYKLADLVNSNDDKQINYYSEYLKLPNERSKFSDSLTSDSTPSLLQLKLINKKKVGGRMNKYRADLCLLLNLIENSFIYYFKAYNALKKEQDQLWSASALFGLCLTSCYYTADLRIAPNSSSASLPTNLYQIKSFESDTSQYIDTKSKKSTKSLEVFKNKFKRQFTTPNKDLEEYLVTNSELYSNFRDILNIYNKSMEYSYLEFELCLMMAKYFIEKNLPKHEIHFFINNCIYINTLHIKEEPRMRRYLEISKLYEQQGMLRLSSFYKWISAGRIFRLMNSVSPQAAQTTNNNEYNVRHLKRVLSKCINIIVNICENLCLNLPLKPAEKLLLGYEKGFPSLKKRILAEIIQLYHFNNCIKESIKFTRYLLHEMYQHLTSDEINYFSKFLYSTPLNKHNFIFNEAYYTQFFNLPLLNSLRLDVPKDDQNQISKLPKSIELAKNDEKPASIYIHRYENPLLMSNRKPILYTLIVDNVYTIEMILSNPLPIEIQIDKIYFITDSDKIEETADIQDYKFAFEIVNFEAFKLAPNSIEYNLKLNIKSNQTGKFKIIGYLINSFNGYSKIYFSDLIKEVENKKFISDAISPSYNIEILPRLPIINYFAFKKDNSNELFELTSNENVSIDCFTGESHNLDLFIKHDEETPDDFEIINIKFQVLNLNENDKNTVELVDSENKNVTNNHLNSKICMKSDNLCTNLDKDTVEEPYLHSNMNCVIELKYTNKLAHSQYLCRTIRRNFFVKFFQIITLTNLKITDLNEHEFQLELSLKNFHHTQNVKCEYTNNNSATKSTITSITPNKETKLKTKLTKLNFDLFENNDNLNEIFISKLLNGYLKMKLAYEKNNEFVEINFDFTKFNLNKYKDVLFKMPISISLIKKTVLPNQLINFHIGFNLNDSKLNYQQFSYELFKKLNYSLVQNNCKKTFKDLKKDELYVENIKILQRNVPKNKDNNVKIGLNLLFENSFNFKWNYLLNIDDAQLVYISQKYN